MVGQTHVVVIAESQQRLAVDHHFRALRALQQRALTIEMFGTPVSQTCAQIEGHASLEFSEMKGTPLIPCDA